MAKIIALTNAAVKSGAPIPLNDDWKDANDDDDDDDDALPLLLLLFFDDGAEVCRRTLIVSNGSIIEIIQLL